MVKKNCEAERILVLGYGYKDPADSTSPSSRCPLDQGFWASFRTHTSSSASHHLHCDSLGLDQASGITSLECT